MDRVEQVLASVQSLQGSVATLTTNVAVITERIGASTKTATDLDALEKRHGEHLVHDASTHATLKADLGRLWWGLGIIIAAVVGNIVATVLKGSQ
jgi:prefoldin subunit 5